jgi:hypothetical protein
LPESLTVPSRRLKEALPYLVFAVTAVVWVIVQIRVGRFMTTDEIAFKAPGREWAATGRFAAPELEGFLGSDFRPSLGETYGIQPPLYPLVFGLFRRAFGFGPMQSTAFDALLHAMFSGATVILARRLAPGLWPGWSVAAGMIVLPIMRAGRPEELVGLLATLSVIPLLGDSGNSVVVAGSSGLVLGLSAFAGPVAAAAAAVGGTILVLLSNRFWRRTLPSLIPWFTGATTSLTACSVVFFALHPGAWIQFRQHVGVQTSASLSYGLMLWVRYYLPVLMMVAACALVSIASAKGEAGDRDGFRNVWMAWAAPALLLFTYHPGKPYYLWALAPMIAATTAIRVPLALARRGRGSRSMLFGAAILTVMATLLSVRGLGIMATFPEEQQLGRNEQLLRDLIPDGSVVLGNDFWPSLAGRVRFISSPHSEVLAEKLDFVLLTANGSGQPGKQQKLEGVYAHLLDSGWEVVHDGLATERPRVLGLPLSRSAWGYGFILYRRTGKTAIHGEIR